jgi:hypothetical protein
MAKPKLIAYPRDRDVIRHAIMKALRFRAKHMHPTAGGWRAFTLWIASSIECGDIIIAAEETDGQQ